MSANTGGPAFPTPEIGVQLHNDNGNVIGCRVFPPSQGMTLLDWYAGQLLTGYVAHNGVSGNFDQHAKDCYDLASAMLAEKARREADHSEDTLAKVDHSPDATKMIELEAANRELVEALDNLLAAQIDPMGIKAARACKNARAILAKHKGDA